MIITGPTASGKTAVALKVAPNYPTEIICADSMTVYKGMDIGTDKPTLANSDCRLSITNTGASENLKLKIAGSKLVNGIPHHLLDIVTPDQEFNVSLFKKIATEKIAEIHQRGNIPFVVGGSTLYIDALAYDFEIPTVKPNPELREQLEQKTNQELFQELVALDPDTEWTIDKNNKRRLIRALEVCLISGQPFTQQKGRKELPHNFLYLSVDKERNALYENINARVDEMIRIGFLDEVKLLKEKYDHNSAMQAAGYKQLSDYLDGAISLEEAVEKTKQVHRNYAKRQLTWLRKNKDVIWVKNESEAATMIDKFLKLK